MSISRRDFVSGLGSLGAVWAATALGCRKDPAPDGAAPEAALPAPVPDPPPPPPQLVHFTAEQAAEIEAMSARIIPTDETPGAREAGVVYFIDKSLTTFAKDQQQLFADGLVKLGKDVKKKYEGETKFSALSADQQDAMLRAMKKSKFFAAVRFATLAGMFAHPKYGGNRDYFGWELVGREPVFEYTPPFGWYDRPENQRALLGEVL
jgi:gluconate 2-dehydrogenase gamma chain